MGANNSPLGASDGKRAPLFDVEQLREGVIDSARVPRPMHMPRAKQSLALLPPASADLATDPAIRPTMLCVFDHSPYLRSLICRHPETVRQLFTDGPKSVLRQIMGAVSALPPDTPKRSAMAALRQSKQRAAIAIALADISKIWALDDVTLALSLFAEAVLDKAVSILCRDIADSDEQATFLRDCYVLLAVGKLGGGELNYSSDVDVIALFDIPPDDAPNDAPNDTHGAGKKRHYPDIKGQAPMLFSRLTRDLVRLIEQRTDDGYVLRVDLRLRPDPLSSNLCVSLDGALSYYESVGQNWERAAMIKARPIAGNRELGRRFIDHLQPFIWRRNLDFAAIRDIQSIKRQIDASRPVTGRGTGMGIGGGTGMGTGRGTGGGMGGSVSGREGPVPATMDKNGDAAPSPLSGWDVKLGQGGIREIEFFVQTQQLIYGGHYPDLRVSSTCEGLRQLVKLERIDRTAYNRMLEAYHFFRHLEHRLQMINDCQTHRLPTTLPQIENLARFLGFGSRAAFERRCHRHRDRVQTIYRALFRRSEPLGASGSLVFTGVDDHPETVATLAKMGFSDPAHIGATIRRWHHGCYPSTRSEHSRQLLTELIPGLLEAFSDSADPHTAFTGFDRFLSLLPAGVALFSLFSARPVLIRFLASIMGNAPRLAERLARRPLLFDQVILPGFSDPLPTFQAMAADLDRRLADSEDFPHRLDVARIWGKDHKFRLNVHLLFDRIDAIEAMPVYSDLADVLLQGLFPWLEKEFIRQYGVIEGHSLAIVGMGKYGGREMRAASDLDILMIYGPDETKHKGNASDLPDSLYFVRLSQRFINAVSAHTAEGELYTVDGRLRPLGRGSAIACGLDAFCRYHRESAWGVEHMALTRFRIVIAPPALRRSLTHHIRQILCLPRDREKLAVGALDTRTKMVAEHGGPSPDDRDGKSLLKVKHMRGGITDIEFIVQYWQLIHAHRHPRVLSCNTLDAIRRLAGAGCIDRDDAEALSEALTLWHRLEALIRLCLRSDFAPADAPPGLKNLISTAARVKDSADLTDTIRQRAAAVREIFIQVFGRL